MSKATASGWLVAPMISNNLKYAIVYYPMLRVSGELFLKFDNEYSHFVYKGQCHTSGYDY